MILSAADQRGLTKLVLAGRAVVVKFKGYWLCAGQNLSQVTVRRLVAMGLAVEDPVGVLHPTERGAALVPPRLERDRYPDVPEADRSVDLGEVTALLEGGPEPWAPPDLHYADEEPVPVDVALAKEDLT